MKDKTLKVLSKLHFSFLILIILIGIFFILIAAPIQIYDKYVIERDKKCFYENTDEWISVYEPEKTSNSQSFDKKTIEASVKCNVNLNNYGGKINAYSKSVINDNSPRPLDMFYIGLGFFGFAIFLILAKKWTIWLFK